MTKRSYFIIKFLQEAARIVPMESIGFGIAGCTTLGTACKCAQAILSVAHTSSLPVSKLMARGCKEGTNRLEEHIPVTRGHMYLESLKKHTLSNDDNNENERNEEHSIYCNPLEYQNGARNQRIYEQPHSKSSIHIKFDEKILRPQFPHKDSIVDAFKFLSQAVDSEVKRLSQHRALTLISGCNIGEAYPISKALSSNTAVGALTPLPQILRKARQDLSSLSKGHKDVKLGSIATGNCDMLRKVNNIIENDLNPCVTMLGGFMEQQIRVPLVNNPLDTAKALQTDSSGAVGVWALFALDGKDIANILSSQQNQAIIIQITKFIEGILSNDAGDKIPEQLTGYNAKLQFLLQVMNKTVTCSSQYISYSLERELADICKKRDITTSTNVETILNNWDVQFKETALALVPKPYQPLLAHWLIWALNIYQLREGLAKYTTVGVIGLVNSGKSTLVNKVFGRQVSNNLSVYNKVFVLFFRQYKVLLSQNVQQYLLFIIWMTVLKD